MHSFVRRCSSGLIVALATGVLLYLAAPSRATAFDDSPTFLLTQGDVIYPRGQATVATAIKLDGLLAKLREDGLSIKVALVETAGDIETVPELFPHPQRYADFLYQSLIPKGRPVPGPRPILLTVTPNGIGVRGADGAQRALIRTVPVDPYATAEQLANAAGLAAQRLALDSGRNGGTAFVASDAAVRDRPAIRTAIALIAALTCFGVLTGVRRRPRAPVAEVMP